MDCCVLLNSALTYERQNNIRKLSLTHNNTSLIEIHIVPFEKSQDAEGARETKLKMDLTFYANTVSSRSVNKITESNDPKFYLPGNNLHGPCVWYTHLHRHTCNISWEDFPA